MEYALVMKDPKTGEVGIYMNGYKCSRADHSIQNIEGLGSYIKIVGTLERAEPLGIDVDNNNRLWL